MQCNLSKVVCTLLAVLALNCASGKNTTIMHPQAQNKSAAKVVIALPATIRTPGGKQPAQVIGLPADDYSSYYTTAFATTLNKADGFKSVPLVPQVYKPLYPITETFSADVIAHFEKHGLNAESLPGKPAYYAPEKAKQLAQKMDEYITERAAEVNTGELKKLSALLALLPRVPDISQFKTFLQIPEAVAFIRVEADTTLVPMSYTTRVTVLVLNTKDFSPILYKSFDGLPGSTMGAQGVAPSLGLAAAVSATTFDADPAQPQATKTAAKYNPPETIHEGKFSLLVQGSYYYNAVAVENTKGGARIGENTGVGSRLMGLIDIGPHSQFQIGVGFRTHTLKAEWNTGSVEAKYKAIDVPLIYAPGFRFSIVHLRMMFGFSPVILLDYSAVGNGKPDGTTSYLTGLAGLSVQLDFSKSLGLVINGMYRASPDVFASGGNYELRDRGLEFMSGVKYALR